MGTTWWSGGRRLTRQAQTCYWPRVDSVRHRVSTKGNETILATKITTTSRPRLRSSSAVNCLNSENEFQLKRNNNPSTCRSILVSTERSWFLRFPRILHCPTAVVITSIVSFFSSYVLSTAIVGTSAPRHPAPRWRLTVCTQRRHRTSAISAAQNVSVN